jgi:hypothetical protein
MRRASTWLLVGSLAALATGCDFGFKPQGLVEDLRVLGVRSTPADLAPGETARLEALTPDPSGRPTTVLWLGCEADPFNLNRTACADTQLLDDPASFVGGELPNGVSLIGFNQTAAYSTPPTLFDVLPAEDSRRVSGTVGQVLALAVAEAISPFATQPELEALFDRVKRKELKSVVSIFRVHVSESPERNANPVLGSLTVDGLAWPEGAPLAVTPGAPVTVDLEVPDADFEPYTSLTPDGPVASQERLLVAWYSTSGRLEPPRAALREDVKTVFTPPGSGDVTDPVPAARTGTLWAVVRDTRGGQSWREWPLYVCDPSLTEPRLTAVEWPTQARSPVVLRGEGLESILFVSVDGRALEQGGWVASRGTWEGQLAEGVALGGARGELVAKTCQRRPLALEP